MKRKENEILELKLKIEKRLQKNIYKWFMKVSANSVKQIAKSGAHSVYVPVEHKSELEKIILEHYKYTVAETMPKGMSRKDNSEISNFIRQIVAEIEKASQEIIDERSEKEIDRIFTATDRRIKELALLAVLQLSEKIEDGQEISNSEVSKIFRNITADRFKNSAVLTSNLQTNWVVEGTRKASEQTITDNLVKLGEEYIQSQEKQILKKKIQELAKYSERESAGDYLENIDSYLDEGADIVARTAVTGFAIIKKTWITKGDDLVRPTHQAVNLKTIPIEETFQVGAYEMLYPSDTSFGAGIEEIANCRCEIIYT
jgi:hypothetical protein